jgi:hypothetical protein
MYKKKIKNCIILKFAIFIQKIELNATNPKEITRVLKKAKSNANWYNLNVLRLAYTGPF